MRASPALHLAAALITVCLSTQHAAADEIADPLLLEGEEALPQEVLLWDLVERQRYVKAREEAERFLVEHPTSYVGHLVFAHAQHFGEANFPKALFHETRALELFEAEH
ncbi:MAG: hypothetical protein O7F08_03805, partial [Deltaproteobacteria bacterium]|nr:hypothetical protein [Deltaproteobacteria bacterium]